VKNHSRNVTFEQNAFLNIVPQDVKDKLWQFYDIDFDMFGYEKQ